MISIGRLFSGVQNIIILLFIFVSSVICSDQKTALVSIPKCGNFLLIKLMKSISKKEVKVGLPNKADFDWQNYFTINHELVDQEKINFCRDNNVKIVFIYRDPRDQVVSAAYFLKKLGKDLELDISLLITSLITNSCYWWKVIGLHKQKGTVKDFFEIMREWIDFDFVYVTSFEKIIGPKGGGDRAIQLEEIKKIAAFCDYNLSEDELEAIANNLWGNRDTFREGKIGAWRKEFSLEQKKLFKEVAGQLLIDLGYEQDLNW